MKKGLALAILTFALLGSFAWAQVVPGEQAVSPAPASQASTSKAAESGATASAPVSSPWRYIAAAVAVSVACIAGGLAVARIGAAAMGAMAENPELSGKALPYVGLAEGICLWGFLVALLILLL